MGVGRISVEEEQGVSTVAEQGAMRNWGGRIAEQECKRLARGVPELSMEEGVKETAEWSARMFRSAEGAEGMASFREKRKPNWIKN